MDPNGVFGKFRLFAKQSFAICETSKSICGEIEEWTALRKSRDERKRKRWTKRSVGEQTFRAGERIMSPVERGSRGGCCPIHSAGQHEIFSRPKIITALPPRANSCHCWPLEPTEREKKKASKYREYIRGVGEKTGHAFVERCAFNASSKKLFY